MGIELSIIIVNYNTKDLLRSCLASVFENVKDLSFEVWVVDNNSSDKSVEMIEKSFPETKIIKNKNNAGFAKANNQAIEKSEGRYVFLLNPDTILIDGGIKNLIGFMNQNPKAGACGPLVLNQDYSMQRQCKRNFPDFWTSLTYFSGLWKLFPENKWWRKKFGNYFLMHEPDDQICEVEQLSGAAMIIRKEALNSVGLLAENYFMYWEDTDLCFRIKNAGYQIYYVPFSRIIHLGGMGGSQIHGSKNLWYFHRGAYLFYKKHLATRHFFLSNFFYYFGVWTAFSIKFILNFFRKKKIIGSKKPS